MTLEGDHILGAVLDAYLAQIAAEVDQVSGSSSSPAP
jgi:hypothetical protein